MKLYKLPDGTPLHRGFSGHHVAHSNDTMTAPESSLLVEDANTVSILDSIATLSVENYSHAPFRVIPQLKMPQQHLEPHHFMK